MKLAFLLAVAMAMVVQGQNVGFGLCTWYGAEGEIPQGWPTACNTGFDRFAMASAHPNVPQFKCGTKIRVTNKSNGKSVVVTVNDKGPNDRPGYILDLTYAAFGEIEDRDKGTTECSYEVI